MIRRAAKIYAANIVAFSLETGAYCDMITDEEHEYLQEELARISNKIMPNIVVATLDEAIINSIHHYTKNQQQ